MNKKVLELLLEEVQTGRLPVDAAVERLRTLPFEDLGFARVDHHRQLRQGFPEVVLGIGKTGEQIARILAELASTGANALATRVDAAGDDDAPVVEIGGDCECSGSGGSRGGAWMVVLLLAAAMARTRRQG